MGHEHRGCGIHWAGGRARDQIPERVRRRLPTQVEGCRNLRLYNGDKCGSKQAQGKCKSKRSHQCNKRLGPHQAIACPCWRKEASGAQGDTRARLHHGHPESHKGEEAHFHDSNIFTHRSYKVALKLHQKTGIGEPGSPSRQTLSVAHAPD